MPAEQPYWQKMRTAAASLAERYGYRRIDTAVLAAGEPHGRSGAIVRAYLEGGLDRETDPARLYYLAPLVRRGSEVCQFGVEVIGEASPDLDAEVIELGWRWFETLRIIGMSLQVRSPDNLIASLRVCGLPFTRTPDASTAFTYRHEGDEGEPVLLGTGDRHDELAQGLGFHPTPAAGFALEMDRTAAVLRRQHPQSPPGADVYGIAIEAWARPYLHRLAAGLRQRGYQMILDATNSGDLETRLDKARRSGAWVAVIAGTSLESKGQVVVRDLQQQTQVTVWEAEVADGVRQVFARRSPA